jgi:D-inositol-3-phosphate glycosyltransferase
MKKRIAIVSENATPFAPEASVQSQFVAKISRRLSAVAEHFAVDVFTRRTDETQPEVFEWSENLRVFHLSVGQTAPISDEDSLKLVPQFAAVMVKIFRQQAYDVVHANFFTSALVALNLKRATETPFVVSFHGLARPEKIHFTSPSQFYEIRAEIEDRAAREAEFVFAADENERRALMYLYDTPPEKICLAPDAAKIAEICETIAARRAARQSPLASVLPAVSQKFRHSKAKLAAAD